MRCLLIVTFAMFTASTWAQEVPKAPPKSPPKVEPKAAPKEAPKEVPPLNATLGSVSPLAASNTKSTVVAWPGGIWPVDGKFYPAGAFNVTFDATKYQLVQQQKQQCVGGVCQLVLCPVLVLKDVVAGTVGTWASGGCSNCPQPAPVTRSTGGCGNVQTQSCGRPQSCGQSQGCSFGFGFSLGGFFSCR
jgi:hypothetical protein